MPDDTQITDEDIRAVEGGLGDVLPPGAIENIVPASELPTLTGRTQYVAAIGAYSDLPPGFVSSTNGIDSDGNVIRRIGVRAAISKRSRNSYSRVSYMYFKREVINVIKRQFDKMPSYEKEHFYAMFNIKNKNQQLLQGLDTFYNFGSNAPNIDGGGTNGNQGAFLKFMLTGIQENFQEKAQIVEVLRDNYIPYFFGSAPSVIQLNGFLLNSMHDQWKYWMMLLYQKVIKGSKLAELPGSPALSIYYEDTRITGYPMSLSIQHDVGDDTALPFTMSFLVKEYELEHPDVDMEELAAHTKPEELYASLKVDTFVDGGRTGFFPDTGNPLVDAALDAVEEFVGDAAEDLLVLTGLDAAGSTIQSIVGGNLNPAEFITNFQNDPAGTLRNVPVAFDNAKRDIAISKDLTSKAADDPNKVKNDAISDNIILGSYQSEGII